MAYLYFSFYLFNFSMHIDLISRNNSNKTESLNRIKFAIFRIGSVVVILSIPFLFDNYDMPIVISSLITGICGLNISYDIKSHLNHRNKL